MRPRRGRWAAAVVAAVALCVFVLAGSGDAATNYDPEELEFLGLINEYRDQNGLRPLLLSDTLAVAAERHSKDMAEYGFFAHDTERSSYYPAGSEPWDRMEAEGYRYNTYKGENLAVGYETAEEAMRAWKESPSHNAAMLDGDYRVVGVARINAPGSVHGWYWTTDFGGHVDQSAHKPGQAPGGERPPERPDDATERERTAPEANRDPVERPPDTSALDNGRMGRLGGWQQRSADGADLVHEEGYARLGGYHDGRDLLRQRIRIPRGGELVYEVRVRTGGEDPQDTMALRLTDDRGKQVAILERYTGRKAVDWERGRVDLSRFAGRTLFLNLEAATDGGGKTTFYVDGLALKS